MVLSLNVRSNLELLGVTLCSLTDFLDLTELEVDFTALALMLSSSEISSKEISKLCTCMG